MSVSSGLIKVIKKGAKAPAKAAPFYSAVDEVAQGLSRNKGTGKEFLREIEKTKGVKPAEIKDRNLDKILNTDQKMTKDDLVKVLEDNPPKQITEDIMGDPTPSMIDQKIDDLIRKEAIDELGPQPRYGYEREDWLDDYDRLVEQKSQNANDYYQAAKEAIKEEGNWGSSKYDRPDWKLAGGENYREIVLKLPAAKSANLHRIMELEAYERRGATNKDLLNELSKLRAERDAAAEEFKSKHWDQPNVLAHMRVQDRVGPNGEKILHVEEIQSDWHQTGRDKGYQKNAEKQYVDYLNDLEKRVAEDIKKDMISEGVSEDRAMELGQNIAKRMADDPRKLADFLGESEKQMSLHQARLADRNAVPDAPFKKNWHELAMKRLINYAAENGYDKIAITPGRVQIDRYEEALRKNLDRLEYEPYLDDNGKQMYEVSGFKGGSEVFSEEAVTPERLQELIGKDTAKKVSEGFGESLAQERPMRPNWKRIESSDLSIGGEGMKGFYDQIVPAYLNKYGEKYGAKVKPISFGKDDWIVRDKHGDILAEGFMDELGARQYAADYPGAIFKNEGNGAELHTFDITPQMREEVLTKGQPLYQQVGIPAATGAAGAEMLGAEMPEEPGFAEGGAVNENTVPDMSDGGKILQGPPFKRGGKVSITNNPDAMFLELNDKKFRRK